MTNTAGKRPTTSAFGNMALKSAIKKPKKSETSSDEDDSDSDSDTDSDVESSETSKSAITKDLEAPMDKDAKARLSIFEEHF
jgi:hypothetical protein